MTTLISKILAVFVTIASVAFMAVVMANVSAGGPNWTAKSKELAEVSFERANPQAPWTAKRRTDNSDMGSGPILPAAIVSVQKKLLDEERTKQADLDAKIAQRKSAITESRALIDADLAAMKRREADLDKQFADLLEQMNQLSQNFTMESKKQTEDLAILKLRSQEYILIKNQLEELKAQREVATEELARLKALVYQAKANLERAQTRQELLKSDGAPIYDDAGAEPVGPQAPVEPAAKQAPVDADKDATDKNESDKKEKGAEEPKDEKSKPDASQSEESDAENKSDSE